MLMNGLLVLAVLSLLQRRTPATSVVAAFTAYLSYLTRPDNGILMIVFPLLALIFLIPRQQRSRLLVYFSSTLLIFITCDSIAKWLVFGSPLPLSY